MQTHRVSLFALTSLCMTLALEAQTEALSGTRSEAQSAGYDLRLVDLDQDGDQDRVYFTFRSAPATIEASLRILHNKSRECSGVPSCDPWPDVTTSWLDPTIVAADFRGLREVNFVDIDQDGDHDMVVAVSLGEDLIFERSAEGFDPPRMLDPSGELSDDRLCGLEPEPCAGRVTASHAVGDIDRDGDPDLVATYRDSRARLYLNDGTGHFVEGQVFPRQDSGRRELR